MPHPEASEPQPAVPAREEQTLVPTWTPLTAAVSGPKFLALPDDQQSQIRKLHNNLGHPTAEKLSRHLAEANAPRNLDEEAKDYLCASCAERQSPQKITPGNLKDPTAFNDKISIDGFERTIVEGSLEVKPPTIWTDEKQRWEESGRRVREKKKVAERRAEERRSEKRKGQKKEDAGARKGRKVAKHCVFPMIFGSGGSKSRLAKAADAEPSGQMRDEKLHTVVAQSTCPNQNVQSTPASDHFWKLRCRKSARCCGVKHISKSKCTKHTIVGPLLELEMSKKCTSLWREAHVEVKMYKTPHVRATFRGSDVLSRGRRKGLWTLSKVSKT